MNYELLYTSFLTNYCNKVNYIIPCILIINTQSTLHCNRYINRLYHLLTNIGHQFRIKHQSRSKTPRYSLMTRTPTIQIDLIISPLLNNLSCLCHFSRILSTNLTNNRMLILRKVQELSMSGLFNMYNSVFINHFCI